MYKEIKLPATITFLYRDEKYSGEMREEIHSNGEKRLRIYHNCEGMNHGVQEKGRFSYYWNSSHNTPPRYLMNGTVLFVDETAEEFNKRCLNI